MMVKKAWNWPHLLLLLWPAYTQGVGVRGVRVVNPPAVLEMPHLVLATTSVLEVRHLVVVAPDTFGVEEVLTGMWAEGVTTEAHLVPHDLSPGVSGRPWSTSNSGSFWGQVNWSFLYGRGSRLQRRHMALLVTGPAPWVLDAAIQMMSRGVLGRWDTLLMAPLGDIVQARDLCPHIPLGVRVALMQLHEQQPSQKEDGWCRGVVRQAQMEDGGRYVLRSVGCWREGQELVLREPFLPAVTSLMGATLKTVIVQGFNEVIPEYVGETVVLKGELGQFLNKVRNNVNFTLDLSYVSGFGVKKNGSFNGAVGVLQRREVDFASASLSVLQERAEVLDFTRWFGMHNTRFLTKMPRLREDHFLLFQIYHWKAWCVIVGFLALASMALGWTWRPTGVSDVWTNTKTRHTAITTTLKTAVYMSSVDVPGNTSGRVVLVWTWVVMIVVVAVYRGNLTSFLSIPRVTTPPHTIRQLIDMGYTLSISRGYSQYAKMKTSPIPDHQEVFRKAQFRQDRGILPEDDVIQEAKTKPIALLVTVMAVTILKDKYSDNIGPVKVCSLRSSSEALFLEIGALGFPRNSPIKELFDRQISRIDSTALKLMPKESCVAPRLEGDTSEALGMVKLGGVLVIWASGLFLASLLFLGETILT
ncbi:glutamate receptor ionotropic, delta-1-like [Panulirus ornatus]|uniref:glutamate receptor ionotropic, delta-1-like n=1 Tax=Panulirus ornatus TaxID=150431 RepID=UPI003A853AEF